MHRNIDKIKKIREFLLGQIEGLSTEQLNNIPAGFNNNIVWNLVHLMSAQQALCYLRSGNAPVVPEQYVMPFLTNTKPERVIDAAEIEAIKALFLESLETLQADFERGIFATYTTSPNILKIYGIAIADIEDCLEFLLYHEGYHVGSILALKKHVG